MNRKKYKYEDYNKSEPTDDATKYFIIYEGKSKEPNYFEAFNETLIDPKKAFVCHVLEEDTGVIGNTPLKLKERAEKFIKNPPDNIRISPSKDDKFRFVLDVDKHTFAHFEELKSFCDELIDGNLFISNYCFEVWLWSHIEELSNIKSNKSSELKTEFGAIQSINYPHGFINYDLIKRAISSCEKADKDKGNYFPAEKSSKVYILINELLFYSHLEFDVEIDDKLQ